MVNSVEYYRRNRDKLLSKLKEYYYKNRDRLIEYKRNYRKKHRKEEHDAEVKRYNTVERRFYLYKRSAKHRDIEFELSFDEFKELWQKPCHYCGEPIAGIGIDRLNSKMGYVNGNVTSCCKICNTAKLTMNRKEFIEKCHKIATLHPI